MGMAGLALLALAYGMSLETARLALPLLIALGAGVTLSLHRRRLAWLGEQWRLAVATSGLVFAAGLTPFWAWALLALTRLTSAESSLALLPLAAVLFATARWWPGRLRRPYDLALQVIGALTAIGAGVGTLVRPSSTTALLGMAALTLVWAFQTVLRRRSLWAALALGTAPVAAALALDRLAPDAPGAYWYALGLLFAGAYGVGGTLLRRSSWRCLTWPGLVWGALTGLGLLLAVAFEIREGALFARHVLVFAALAGLLTLTAALWRRAWPGYGVAALLAADVLLAARGGWLFGWQPAQADFGYILCGVTLGLVLIGQVLRCLDQNQEPRTENQNEASGSTHVPLSPFSIFNSYALPYELVGFALLLAAPLPAGRDAQHACLTWLAMAGLYALACWRYRLPWLAAPALVAADLALLRGADWLGSGGRVADVGLLLLGASWVQGLLGLWASTRERAGAPTPLWQQHSTPVYVVALLSGVGTLALASGASDVLAICGLGLAALAALAGTLERREELAWGALALLALGLGALHDVLGVAASWSLAWGVAEALGVCLVGWLIETFKRSNVQTFNAWYHPLWLGPLLAAGALVSLLAIVAPARDSLPALTFGLATLALLLATLALRRRAAEFAYGAGAALVAAGLCQLFDWGFRQPQLYTVPAGLYLLALAEGLRRFQNRRGLAQLIESGAAVLMLGTALGQSLRAEGLAGQAYTAWLCVEALLILGYGVLRQLRTPFFGGLAFFIFGVLWLSVDPLLAANKWLLLGALGLLLVGAYILLERRQEQLVRAGRAWAERFRGWS
jgi:hypothetical protein